jgi:SAM-dependent methyltransferase
MDSLARLRYLYLHQSKHSSYQVLPGRLREILAGDSLGTRSRHEESRLNFIIDTLEIRDSTILDIGGNTGFFSVELLDRGAASATLYEGNPVHAEFSRLAASVLGLTERLAVVNEYLDLPNLEMDKHFHLALLMNVLHHLGDDFGDPALGVEEARTLIEKSLERVAWFSDFLVFQLGYCWKGNRDLPLFKSGTKQEQVDFMTRAIRGHWEMIAIGIPELEGDRVFYREPTPENMKRQDPLGEFLNRPLFILKSLSARAEKEFDGNP